MARVGLQCKDIDEERKSKVVEVGYCNAMEKGKAPMK